MNENLSSAIKLYDDLNNKAIEAGKTTEFNKISLDLKINKEILNSISNELQDLYDDVVEKTEFNNLDSNDNDALSVGADDTTDQKSNNVNDSGYKKAIRLKKRTDKKIDKVDNLIKRKLDLDGIDGLVAAVYSLKSQVQSMYPELFGYANYNLKKTEVAKTLQTSEILSQDQIASGYEAQIKEGKSPQSAAEYVIKDAYGKSTNFLKEKLNFDPGIAQASVIGLAIRGVLKGYPALRGVFPDGLSGFLLMGLTAYTAAKNIPGDKVKEVYADIFGEGEPGINEINSKPELAYKKLESNEFQNGRLFFKGLKQHLKDPSSKDILSTYFVVNPTTNTKSFDIEQFVTDYEAGMIGYQGSGTAKNLLLRSQLKITPESDEFMAFVAARLQGPNGAQIVQKELQSFVDGISSDNYKDNGVGEYTNIKQLLDQYGTYNDINVVRYNILKKAGYELNSEKGDKRKDIDEILKTISKNKEYTLSQIDLNSIQKLINDGTLTEIGLTGAIDFKINDIIDDKSPILSNISDKKNTIKAIKAGFALSIDSVPEEQKKFIRLVVDKDILYYQHDMPGNGFKGVKIPLQIGGDANISLLSLAQHNEISTDSAGWKRIFEMADYEASLIQLYAGQANPGTKDYFQPTGTSGIKFSGTDMSNRVLKLFNGKNPFVDFHKVPVLLSNNHNTQKSIQEYCAYLNSSQIYGTKLWEGGELPEFYQSIEAGVTGLHEITNVGGDINAIKTKIIESGDNELASRLGHGLEIKSGGNNKIIIKRLDDGKKPLQMTIVQLPNYPNRWSLQYYDNGVLTNFPRNTTYEGLGSADKCIRLADKLLGVQMKFQNRGNSQFHDPFFVKTKETMHLGGVKLWETQGDDGIYFINDKNHSSPYSSKKQVLDSFGDAEQVLSFKDLAKISPQFAEFNGHITNMINNMTDGVNGKKSQWFAGQDDRPKNNPEIVYETILGKGYNMTDKFVRNLGSLGRGLITDAGEAVIETAHNISSRVLDTIYNNGQPRDFNKYMLYDTDHSKQLNITEIKKKYNSPTQSQEYVCDKTIKYGPFAGGFTMINYLMSGKSDYKDTSGTLQSSLSFDDAFDVVCSIDPKFKAGFKDGKIDGALKKLGFTDDWAKNDIRGRHEVIKDYYEDNQATIDTGFSMEVIKSQLIGMGNDGVGVLKDGIDGAIKMTGGAITEIGSTTGDVLKGLPGWIQAGGVLLAVGKAIGWIIPF